MVSLFFLIWSHRIAACLENGSLHPIVTAVCVIPSHHISTHLTSRLLSFFHLIPSHPISCLLSLAQRFSADHNWLFSSHVTWAFLISYHLISAVLRFAQLFSTLLSSPQLMSAHLMSFDPSSKLFSHLLSWSQLLSAVSPHLSSSQRTLKSSQLFSGSKPAPNKDLGVKAWDPYAFHREDLTHRSFDTETRKLLHRDRETFTQRQGSLHTELGKLLFTTSFYTEQTFAHSELLHRKAFTHRSFYTQKLLHKEAFTPRSFTQRSSYTQQAFTHSKLLHREAFTQKSFYTEELLHTASFHTEKHLHREASTHRSFYTQKLLHTEALHTASFYTKNLLQREAFTQRSRREAFTHRNFYTEKLLHTHTQAFWHNGARNCSSKTGSRRQSKKKKTILKHCWKGIVKRKSPVQQITIATLLQ